MNIDERLQRLAERHEALAKSGALQSLTIERILVAIEKSSLKIAALARIAETHERRFTDFEGNSPS